MSEIISQLWAWLHAWNILEIAAASIVVMTLLEKAFDVEFLGRRIFRLIGRLLRFFCNWIIWPVKPKIAAVKAVLEHGDRLDKSLKQIIETDKEREERRTGQFEELRKEITGLKESAKNVESELTLNGGKSMKDQVMRLVKHDEEKWHILEEVLEFVGLTSLRLDIADEARKCMTFRLSATGEYISISAMFLRFFGYTEKDVIGSDWEFCIAKQSIVDVQEHWRKAITKRQHYRRDQFIVDSDGKEHYCRVQGYPMTKNGEFQGFYGTFEVLDADMPK